ncbi:MAG: hypothetical protein IJV22_07240 [Bacteroidales bacterium]|nr:hypothetical protein [Bacteroidales bacterium]
MKNRFVYVATCVALMLTAASCSNNEEQIAAQQRMDSLQNIIDTKDGEIEALFDVLNQIEDNLSVISAKYSNVKEMKRGNMESNYNVKGEIKEQMTTIESMMAENKKKIGELNARLASMGKENSKLQDFVNSLQERMAQQEAQISDLTSELEQKQVVIRNLNENVTTLTQSNREKDEFIAMQAAEANKAYFVVGSYKELKELGIVSKSGGFIGIGKKQNTTGDMDTEKFTMIDRSRVTTISINQRKAVVISKHPSDSYELVPDDDDPSVVAFLKILNPAAFWKYTDYLVVSTK